MTDRSGDFVWVCLILYLLVLVIPVYKSLESELLLSLTPLFLSLHHYYSTQPIMSSPAYTSFPFSYKEDTCAQDVVESMEQVGDLASLCLK